MFIDELFSKLLRYQSYTSTFWDLAVKAIVGWISETYPATLVDALCLSTLEFIIAQ